MPSSGFTISMCVCVLSHSVNPILCSPRDVVCQAPMSMDSPGKNTRVGCHSLLQGIFLNRDWIHISYLSCIDSQVLCPLALPAAAAAAAKSLQSYPTLCDPRDSSPPGSPIPRILQARTLEWIAIPRKLQILFSILSNLVLWKEHHIVLNLSLALTSRLIFDKSFNFSYPYFSHLFKT